MAGFCWHSYLSEAGATPTPLLLRTVVMMEGPQRYWPEKHVQ